MVAGWLLHCDNGVSRTHYWESLQPGCFYSPGSGLILQPCSLPEVLSGQQQSGAELDLQPARGAGIQTCRNISVELDMSHQAPSPNEL